MIEEEEPELQIVWMSSRKSKHRSREKYESKFSKALLRAFGVSVQFDTGILYKETIDVVEGWKFYAAAPYAEFIC